ncbi:MAG: zinc ribbon domain-containing protein [Dehalococcoidia bacterium]|nr:zinc ribbon domain-containing protein [Dehalococcoidia bacterium]
MQQYLSCPRCGTSNYWGQPYCAGCGAPLTVSCPRCGAWMSPSSGFCTNCGAQPGPGSGQGPRQPVTQHKPTSGWSIFGGFLFVLGVLGMLAGPILMMLKPEAEQSTSQLIKWIVAGGVGVMIGLPLMFKR